MNKTTFTVADDKKTLYMERRFNAPAQKLWQAYADSTLLAQWFSPAGWSTEVKKHEFKNGGEYIYEMRCEDKNQGDWYGKTSAGKMVFSNITPETSFEYSDYFTDDNGAVNESMPVSVSKVDIINNGDGTAILKVATAYKTEAELKQVIEMGMEEGYSQTLDKLDALIAN